MLSKSKAIALALICAVLPTATIAGSARAAATPDEQFVTPQPPTADRYTAMLMMDGSSSRNPLTLLLAKDSANRQASDVMTSQTVCSSFGEKDCGQEKYLQYSTVLNKCESDASHDCVKDVSATTDTGKSYTVNYVSKFPAALENPFTGDVNAYLPEGGTSFLVSIPDLPHQGGNQYLISVEESGSKDFGATQFHMDTFQAAIYAVSSVTTDCSLPSPETDWKAHSITVQGRANRMGGCWDPVTTLPRPCVNVDKHTCLISWPLPLDVNFGLTLKLHTTISGWLHGRLSDVQSTISKAADGDQIIQVSGKPTQVPGLFAAYKKTELPEKIKAIYANDPHGAESNGSGWGTNPVLIDGNPYSILKGIFNYDDGAFKEMLAWVDSVGNKATFSPTVWSAHSIQGGNGYGNCLSNNANLSGLVTTNASMYIGEPPAFNKNTGALEYKVAAPHYAPDGSVFKGIYNLAISSSVARCLYGFTSAPVTASITVLGTDGQAEVATTSLTEHDGWIYLKAAGFTFSSPTVQVKFMQEGSAKPTATSQNSTSQTTPSVVSPKKITITCTKGKTIKKVTAIAPSCPSGYKKK